MGPPSPLFAVPNPSTATVPTSDYSMWHYNYLCPLKGQHVFWDLPEVDVGNDADDVSTSNGGGVM